LVVKPARENKTEEDNMTLPENENGNLNGNSSESANLVPLKVIELAILRSRVFGNILMKSNSYSDFSIAVFAEFL